MQTFSQLPGRACRLHPGTDQQAGGGGGRRFGSEFRTIADALQHLLRKQSIY